MTEHDKIILLYISCDRPYDNMPKSLYKKVGSCIKKLNDSKIGYTKPIKRGYFHHTFTPDILITKGYYDSKVVSVSRTTSGAELVHFEEANLKYIPRETDRILDVSKFLQHIRLRYTEKEIERVLNASCVYDCCECQPYDLMMIALSKRVSNEKELIIYRPHKRNWKSLRKT